MREKHIQIVITKKFVLKKHLPFYSQRQFKLTYSFLVLKTCRLKKKKKKLLIFNKFILYQEALEFNFSSRKPNL